MALVRQGEYRVCGKRVYSMNLYVNLPNDHSHNSLNVSHSPGELRRHDINSIVNYGGICRMISLRVYLSLGAESFVSTTVAVASTPYAAISSMISKITTRRHEFQSSEYITTSI